MLKKVLLISGVVIGVLTVVLALALPAGATNYELTPIEKLGKMLFLDKGLSVNQNQSCATCHAEEFGFTGPKGKINVHGAVYPGSNPTLFGDRRPPTAAYGGESTILDYDEEGEVWVGGMFWDGRASGWDPGRPTGRTGQRTILEPG